MLDSEKKSDFSYRLLHFFQGQTREINPEDIPNTNGFAWLQIHYSGSNTVLKEIKGLPNSIKPLVYQGRANGGVLTWHDTIVTSFPVPRTKHVKTSHGTRHIRLQLASNMLVTIHRHSSDTLDHLELLLRAEQETPDAAVCLHYLFQHLINESSSSLESIREEIDTLEDKMASPTIRITRPHVNAVRRRLITCRRQVSLQKQILSQLLEHHSSCLSSSSLLSHIETHLTTYSAILNDLSTENARSAVLHEELFSIQQEMMNRKMYVLTLISVIFMPLSFLTGLLGVNVGGIPGATFKDGFWIVVLALGFLSAVQYTILKLKHWF